jgi:hypothetical protein
MGRKKSNYNKLIYYEKNKFLEQIRKETPEEVKVFVSHHADNVICKKELLEKKLRIQNK